MRTSAAAREPVPYRLLAAMFLAALALRPDIIGLGPLLDPMRADLGGSRSIIGLLPTVPVLCMGLFAPVASQVAVRVGPRRVILAGMVAIAGGGLLRSTMPTTASVVALTVIIGVGVASVQTLLPAVVKARAAAHPTLATTVYVVGIQSGAAISAGVSATLVHSGGWRLPLTLFGVAATMWTLIWLLLGPRDVPREDVPTTGRVQVRRSLWGRWVVWRLALAFGSQSLVFYGLNAWLVSILIEQGWSPVAAGGSLSIFNLVALSATLATPLLSRWLRTRRRTLIVCAMASVLGIALVLSAPADAWWATLLLGFGIGPLLPLTLSLPLDVSDEVESVGEVSGIMLGVGYVLAATAPVSLGWVRDLTGSYVAVVGILVLILMAFMAICMTLGPDVLRRGLREPAPVPDGGA